ncbi:hypothetical protein VQ574_21165 (plasmid) [Stutzerimonas frequens]|uniref:hypothetical protein n=1 Tax=Stutzerimonas frequens TaxID=2968969 RepID=UPI002DB88588|nr:hypothetical protein [Stutzerimonas frequens]WRW29450.1 hypothetical protein VQ574_21165 [Stutzerimonas frequens]
MVQQSGLTDEFLAEQARVLKSIDPAVAFKFAKQHNAIADIPALERIVCSDDLEASVSYKFAKEVKGADIGKLLEHAFRVDDSETVLLFAKDVPGADPKKIEQMVIERNMHEIAGEFVNQIPGSNFNELQELVLASRCAESIVKFAKTVGSADKQKLGDALNQLPSSKASFYRHSYAVGTEDLGSFDMLRFKAKYPDVDTSGVKIHYRDSTSAVYDDCNTGIISKGDIVVVSVERVIALGWTWPIAVTKDVGEIHSIAPGYFEDVLADARFDPINVGIAIELVKDYSYDCAEWVQEMIAERSVQQNHKTGKALGM